MRTSSVFLSLSTIFMLAGSCNVGAQAVPIAPGEPSVLPEISVMAAAPRFPIRLEQVRKVRGLYAMSNGWTMEVRPDWRRMYVQLGTRPEVEVIPVSPDKFVSADGSMAMEFNLGPSENEVVLRYVPDASTAQVIEVRSTMAQR